MSVSNESYLKMVNKISPDSPKAKDFLYAFTVGGGICVLGQLVIELGRYLEIDENMVQLLAPCTLIFISSVLTGLRIFEKIARRAGAGTLVPITGFANAVVSPAIEFRNEGYILGVGAKIFTIAGPVILYGTFASFLYGILYWIYERIV